MSYKRADMNLRTTISGSSTAATSPSSSTAATPSSPVSPSSPTKASASGYFTHRLPSRSVTIDTVFGRSRSRSKSPKPPSTELPSSSGLKLSNSSSSPTSPTSPRHKSDGAIPTMSDRKDSFFKPQKKHTGSMGTVGRHSNDWLFGGVSLSQTAKGLVRGRNDSK